MTSSMIVQRAELSRQIRAAFRDNDIPRAQQLLRADQLLLESVYGKLAQ